MDTAGSSVRTRRASSELSTESIEEHRGTMRRVLKRAWGRVKPREHQKKTQPFADLEDDLELDDLETPPRYRPDSIEMLCKATRFNEAELKCLYRAFKAECPSGVVREDAFKGIYARFFPQGANAGRYAHYVFNTLDHERSGLLSFEDFVVGLSTLSRGTLDEKLRWTFSLYDINGDGRITREEMTDIVSAIYELTGKHGDSAVDDPSVAERVDRVFQKMDANRDGVVTLEEFLEGCARDEHICRSMAALESTF